MHYLKNLIPVLFYLVTLSLHAQMLPFDPSLKYGQLENGMRYYIRNSGLKGQGIYVNFLVKVGRLHEKNEQLGMAHLTEHMGFQALRHFPNNIYHYLSSYGISGGNEINAYTGPNYTSFYLTIPSGKATLLDSSLLIVKDWACGMSLIPSQVDSERGVVIAEMLGNPQEIRKGEYQVARMVQPKHPVVGQYDATINNLQVFPTGCLREFYAQWYLPDRQAIIIVGDVDVAAVEQQIRDLFNQPASPKKVNTEVNIVRAAAGSTGKTNAVVKVYDQHALATRFTIHWIFPQQSGLLGYAVNKKQVRNQLIGELYNQLAQIRYSSLDSTGIQNMLSAIERGAFYRWSGLDDLQLSFQVPAGQDMKASVLLAMQEIERIRRYGFTPHEFALATSSIIHAYEQKRVSNQRYADYYLGHFVFGAMAPDAATAQKYLFSLLNSISLGEVNEFAKNSIFYERDINVLVTGPSKALREFSCDSLLDWIKQAKKTPLTAPVDHQQLPLLSDLIVLPSGTPAYVSDSSHLEKTGVLRYHLSNGLRILLKPLPSGTSTKNTILFSAFAPASFGEASTDLSSTSTTFMNTLNGLGGISRADLKKIVFGKGLSAATYISNGCPMINARCAPNGVEAMLQLIYLYFTAPNQDSVAFANWPHRNPSTNTLAPFTFQDIYTFFRSRYSEPSRFTFILTGDFDPHVLLSLIVHYFGGFPAVDTTRRDNNVFAEIPAPHYQSSVRSLEEDTKEVRFQFSGSTPYDEWHNIQLHLLEKVLHTQLLDRLRRQEGATYSIDCSASAMPDSGGIYRISIHFTTRSETAEEMKNIVQEEIKKMQTEPLSSEIFQQAVAQVQATFDSQLKSNSYWLHYLASQAMYHLPPESILARPTLLSQMTPDTIMKAARDYLQIPLFIHHHSN